MDEPTASKQVRRELLVLSVMCYEDRSQRPPDTSRSGHSEKPPTGKSAGTDAGSSFDEEETSNDCLPTEPAFR